MPFLLLMPSYNQSHYIAEAVQSVLAQDDPNWELWIVDNSTDDTPQVMRRFADPRIRFHHIAERMDPGSCLNWMLERAVGRDFSYVHTDNNLHSSYVRRMREVLAEHPLSLGYCDMRTIDERGRYVNVYRRGSFDLSRLLSVDSLGVPFAATTELARRLDGFSARDFADDVRFCVGAYGMAHYVYVPEALVDYRLHGDSRTNEAGGSGQIERIFVNLMPKIVPVLEARGVKALAALESAIERLLGEVDLFVEDVWYRRLAGTTPIWWEGLPKADYFFASGMLEMDGFSRQRGKPTFAWWTVGPSRMRIWPWQAIRVRLAFYRRRRELRQSLRRARNMLLTWAAIKLDLSANAKRSIRIRSFDFRTIWAARQLQIGLGITLHADLRGANVPPWLRLEQAGGDEPLLECKERLSLSS